MKNAGKKILDKLANRARAANGPAFDILSLSGQLADGDTITINGTTYEADDNAAVTAGNVLVDITANASAADDIDDLVAAIKTNQGDVLRVVDFGDELAIVGRTGKPFVLAEVGANSIWIKAGASGNGFAGTDQFDDVAVPAIQSRAAIASEVTLGKMVFAFGLTPAAVVVHVRTAAGVAVAHAGAATIDGELVILDNTGATDFAATDVVTVLATF